MLADEFPGMDVRSPQSLGGSPVSIDLYVEDADAIFNQTVAAGATVKRLMAGRFYGDRLGGIEDPIGTYVVDLNPQGRFVRRRDRKARCC
jgi:PhnB protein